MTDPNLSPDTPRDDVAPPPSTPTATPKAPPPPLMGRAPRPGAVRIRKLVVQGAVMVAALLFALYGWSAFRQLPIEAFPDVTDPMVEVVGLYPGQAAEEVEKRVTLELERVLAGTPRLVDLRSVSVFGLALVTLTFEENTPDFELRTLVAERLRDADLPDGAETVITIEF